MRAGGHSGKIRRLALAEICAAISYALSNLEEITGEIEQEDRLNTEAPQTRAVSAALYLVREPNPDPSGRGLPGRRLGEGTPGARD